LQGKGGRLLKIDKSKEHGFPKDEKAWARFFQDMIFTGLSDRQNLETQWARNIAYYYGFQHLLYDATLRFIQVDDGRHDQYIINRIAPFVEQRVAKLTRSKPTLTVTPDKTDQKSIMGASLSKHLLKNIWKVNNKDDKLDTTTLYSVLTGSGFRKTVWDASGGEGVRDEQDQDGNLTFDEDNKKTSNITYLGDISTSCRTSYEILASAGAKNIENARWIVDRPVVSIDEVKAKHKDFKIDRAMKEPEALTRFEKFVNTLGYGGPYGLGGFSGFGGYTPGGAKNGATDLENVVYNEIWIAPNRIYKKGILGTLVGDQLLQLEEWPQEHKNYPFVKQDEHKNPFGFYGTSTVTRLIPVQQHYNEARTQISKNAQLMANSKWWVALGSGLSEDSLTDEEGEIIQTNGNMPVPRQIGVAPLPNYVIENQNQDINDFRDIGGERSVDQQPFSNLTAGVAIETMSELADVGLGPSIKNIERTCIKEGEIELLLANENYDDERTLKIISPNGGDINIQVFNNMDLAYQTDVSVHVESGFASSKAGTRQTLMDMWDRRIIFDPEQFINAYATGNIDILLEQKDPAKAVVIQDIEMIKQGAQPPVAPFDNHIIYIKMLSEFVQTPEFRKMPPDRQMLAYQTLQAHLQFIQPQQEEGEQNQAAVNTPFGQQRPEGA